MDILGSQAASFVILSQSPNSKTLPQSCGFSMWQMGKGTQGGSELERRGGDAESLQGHGARSMTCPGVSWQVRETMGTVQADWAATSFAVRGKHAVSVDQASCRVTWEGRG